MKNIGFRILGIFSILSVFFIGAIAKTPAEKIKPEELVAKHLQSLGSAETLKSHKSFMTVGTSKAVFKGRGKGLAEGLVVLASQGEKNMIGMKFNNPDYQFETMGYDGSNFSVGFAKPGTRSPLGGFLRVNQKTFRNGLMGGVLTTSWELLNYDKKRGKLKYSGTKKVNGIKLLKFNYSPKKGSDLEVNLFFDPTTYRHVRTEYRRVITSKLGTGVDNSAQQSETRYRLVEKFGDFKPENGLTLPHSYGLYLEILTGSGSIAYDWTMNLKQFAFNQQYDVTQFRVGSIS